jgi:MFS family permease
MLRIKENCSDPLAILYFVTLNALGHVAFVGARMATVLFAHDLGASAFTTGLLLSLFAALPMLLSVATGRLIDRAGPARPLAAAFVALVVGNALPFMVPQLWILFLSSTVLGTAFMLVHIAMNSVFGAYGGPERRAMNFSWLALGFAFSGAAGPLVAGYAIEGLGYARAFLVLSLFPVAALALLWGRKQPLPRPEHAAQGKRSGVMDLLRVAALRRMFLVSALLAMGWDLYSFLLPLYGAQIGLAASTIGVVMSTFAAATFVVRLAMPFLIRRIRQWIVIASAMAVSGAAYLLFPLVEQVPALMALSFLLGLGLGCAQPVIMSLLYEASPPGRQGEVVGVRTLTLNASHTFIPLASGALSAALGMAPVFVLLAAGLLTGAWFSRQQVK